MNLLRLVAFSQHQNSVCADIQIVGTVRTVSSGLAERLIALRPQIVAHACKSATSGYFGERLVGALLPHALEHLAIDLLVERFSLTPSSQAFAGATTWLDRTHGCMCVRIGCTSDDPAAYFQATEATLQEAVHLMNQLLAADKPNE